MSTCAKMTPAVGWTCVTSSTPHSVLVSAAGSASTTQAGKGHLKPPSLQATPLPRTCQTPEQPNSPCMNTYQPTWSMVLHSTRKHSTRASLIHPVKLGKSDVPSCLLHAACRMPVQYVSRGGLAQKGHLALPIRDFEAGRGLSESQGIKNF